MARMRGTSWVAVLLVIVVGSALGIAAGSFLACWIPNVKANHGSFMDIFAREFGGKRYVRILMMGEDNTGRGRSGGHGLSDTLVVIAVDTKTKNVRAISIPRDTRVEIPGHGICKINAANAFGGPELSKQVVQQLLGVDIDYYVKTTTTGLKGLVSLVGGVYIVVDENMHYNDNHGKLHINLKASPEKQLLNAEQAEGYVRFRHDAFGDSGYKMKDGKKVSTGRIVRQQYFMRALANRILSLPTRRERADILRQAYEKHYIESNLKLKDWNGLADFFKDVDPEKMVMTVLPGAPGRIGIASYWIPDDEKIPQVVAQNMRFEGNPGDDSATVEVLNGSGISGAAGKVADKLKKAGFEVEREGNAPDFTYDRCMVITHKGRTEGVRRIAALLNCDEIREEVKTGSGKSVDVTVIVGRDFKEY